jgi:hypothetical protein
MKSYFLAALVGLMLCLPSPARAQLANAGNQDIVSQAKEDLRRAGVKVENGACTDFEIAKLVAGRIPGAGLLVKDCCGDENDNQRSHCQFKGPDGRTIWYAHDFVAFADGSGADVAIASGESNGPSWQINPPNPDYVGKYRSAVSLGLTGVVPGGSPVPGPTPVPVPSPSVDLTPLLNDIAALKVQVTQLRQANEDLQRQIASASDRADNAQQEAGAANNKADDVITKFGTFKLPKGCRVQFLACRLEF